MLIWNVLFSYVVVPVIVILTGYIAVFLCQLSYLSANNDM